MSVSVLYPHYKNLALTDLEQAYLNKADVYNLQEQLRQEQAEQANHKKNQKEDEISFSFVDLPKVPIPLWIPLTNIISGIFHTPNPYYSKKSLPEIDFNEFPDIATIDSSNSKLFILQEKINKLEAFAEGLNVTDTQNVNLLINDLVGGKKAYDSLKTIDLHNVALWHGSIIIKHDQLSDSVSKFTDKLGRKGIAICVAKVNSEDLKVQTFYQEMHNSPNWVSAGDTVIPVEGDYFLESGVLQKDSYLKLKELIKNKTVKIESPVDGTEEEWVLKSPIKR